MRMADRDTYKFAIVSMVRGYHEYQSVWSAVVREELQCSTSVDRLIGLKYLKSTTMYLYVRRLKTAN